MFFDRSTGKPYSQCRRYPKVIGEVVDNHDGSGAYYRFVYPIVHPTDYCGEWKDKDGITFEDLMLLSAA